MNTYDPVTGQYALPNTPDAINAYKKAAEMRNTDWFDLLFSNAVSQNHSVSISTGTEKASFYASLSALTDPGWYKQSEVKRYTANLNTTYNISEKLSVGLIANASYRKQKAPGTLSATVDAASGEVTRDFDLNPYSYALNSSRALDPHTFYTANYAPFNILHELDHNNMELNIVDLRFQSELKYKPIRVWNCRHWQPSNTRPPRRSTTSSTMPTRPSPTAPAWTTRPSAMPTTCSTKTPTIPMRCPSASFPTEVSISVATTRWQVGTSVPPPTGTRHGVPMNVT